MSKKVLRAGDTLTVPKGWTVEIEGGSVTVYGPGYLAFGESKSRRGYTFADFILEADAAAEWPESYQTEDKEYPE